MYRRWSIDQLKELAEKNRLEELAKMTENPPKYKKTITDEELDAPPILDRP